MKSFVAEFRRAFPDFHDSIDIQVAEGDLVVTRFTFMGTHRGTFMGVEPTNRELVWTGISIDRISGGKIVESWANWDMMGMMQQLGAISPSGEISEEASPTYTRRRRLDNSFLARCLEIFFSLG